MARIGRSLAILALLLAACRGKDSAAPAVVQKREILEVQTAESISASPDGRLWICARDGRVYVSSDWNQTWFESVFPEHETESGSFLWFFDAQHALMPDVSEDEATSAVLQTEDGGLSWSSVALPFAGFISDGQLEPDGSAWLASQAGQVLVSADYGRTWRATARPFEDEEGVASIRFRTSSEGYAGSYSNALKRTTDGGQSWAALATPADELCPPDPESTEELNEPGPMTGKDGKSVWRSFSDDQHSRISTLWVVDDQLLASQGGQLFHRPLSALGGWRLFELDGHRVVLAIAKADGLAVVTDDLRVAVLSRDLHPLSKHIPILANRVSAIAACDRGVVLLDHRGKVCTLTGDNLECSRLHTAGPAHEWKILSFDRTADGTLFGVTSSALYSSKDAGKSWEFLAEGENLSSVHARSDGKAVLVQGEFGWCLWSTDKPQLLSLSGVACPPPDASIAARHGPLWIAHGFEAAKDKETQRMLHSTDTVLAGPNFTATVFASADDGRSWKSIDRYVGGIVHALWLGNDDTLSLCMSDGAIRRGPIGAAGGLETVSPAGTDLGGEWASWIVFPEPRLGWSGGYHYFGGPVTHHTQDGGRNWTPAETVEDRYIETYLLGAGGSVRMVGGYRQPCRLEIWRDGKFEALCDTGSSPHDALVDSTGALLVRLDNAEVWSLDRDGREWKRLGQIEFPER